MLVGGVYSRLEKSMGEDLDVDIAGYILRTTNSHPRLSIGCTEEVSTVGIETG